MNLRLALYELAARHRLADDALAALCLRASFGEEPPQVAACLPRVAAAIAAVLVGLGIVFGVAAQWDGLGRLGKFALLQALVLATIAGAAARPVTRVPAALLGLIAIGALFAYFGQTYQTGADTWQIFAWWALLALPLALTARSDLVWAPWTVVANVAAALWVKAHTAHYWRFDAQDFTLHALAWLVVVALAAVLGPAGRRVTGAGNWSYRVAILLASVVVVGSALGALFAVPVAPQYGWGLAVVGVGLWALVTPRGHDVFGLSVLALAANVLLVAGMARWMFDRPQGNPLGLLGVPVIILAAAGMLAASVTVVMGIERTRRSGGAQ